MLLKTAQENRWIITAIDYATEWPVAKAIPKQRYLRSEETRNSPRFALFVMSGGHSKTRDMSDEVNELLILKTRHERVIV